MQPNQQDNGMWISKEEYERLQQAQAVKPAAQPYVYSQAAVPADASSPVGRTQAVVGALLAIALFISLTQPFFKVVAVPVLVMVLLFAAMSLQDYFRIKQARESGATTATTNADGSRVKPVKVGASKYSTLLIVTACILAAPVVVVIGIIVLILAVTAGGGGQSS